MFGKLFAYTALIRSHKMENQPVEACVSLFDRIWLLHNKRTWIQELTIETLLSLVSSVSNSAFLEKAFDKIAAWLNASEDGPNANQIMCRIGLQHLAQSSKAIAKAMDKALGTDRWNVDSLTTCAAALVQSSKKFPQVHKVWDYITSFVIPLSADRELPLTRADSLSAEATEALAKVMAFVSQYLWTGSKEKRALAMKLTVKLLRLVPSEHIPDVLTAQAVKALIACRLKSINMLYDTAGAILEELASSVADSNASRLAMLGVLSQHSGANFDKQTHTSVMSTLLAALDEPSAKEYLKLLCGVLVSEKAAENADAEDREDNDDEDEEERETISHFRSLIVSMVQLAKTRTFANTASVVPSAVVAVLLRLTCFLTGATQLPLQEGKKAKSSKKDKKKGSTEEQAKPSADEDMAFMLDCIHLIEQSSLVAEIQEEDLQFAIMHLQAGVSDILMFRSHSGKDDQNAQAALEEKARRMECVFKLWSVVQLFYQSNVQPRPVSANASKGRSGRDAEQLEEGEVDSAVGVAAIHSHIVGIYALMKQVGDYRVARLAEAVFGLIVLAMMHVIISKDVSLTTVMETSATMLAVLQGGRTGDAEDDEEEEDPVELRVYEVCVDLLSSVSEVASRGMREAIKRFWSAYVPLLDEEQVSGPLLDAVVGAVTDAEDITQALEAADGDEMMDEEEEENVDEEDEEEVEEEEVLPVKAKGAKAGKSTDASRNAAKAKPSQRAGKQAQSNDEEEEAEEEDIMINENDMIDFLMQEDDDAEIARLKAKAKLSSTSADRGSEEIDEDMSDEDEQGPVHTEEADQALVNLISQRKQNRKAGHLAALSKHFLLRTRILDILQVFINKIDSGLVLFCMYRPMLLALRKAYKSRMREQVKVGPAFLHRYEAVLKQDLLKRKAPLRFTEEDREEEQQGGEGEEGFMSIAQEFEEELKDLISSLADLVHEKDLPQVRLAAQEMIIATTRLVAGCQQASAQQLWLEFIASLVQRLTNERRAEVNVQWLHTLVVERYPAFLLPHLWPVMVQGLQTTSFVYARNAMAEMLGVVLKRGKKCEESVRTVVGKEMHHLLNAWKVAMESVLLVSVEKEKDKAGSVMKHVKPVATGVKECLEYLVQVGGQGAEVAAAIAALSAPLAKLKEWAIAHTQQKSSATIKIVEECVGLLDKAKACVVVKEGGAGEESKSGKKGGKKRAMEPASEKAEKVVGEPIAQAKKQKSKQGQK